MPDLQYSRVVLFVEDIDKSKEFYQDLFSLKIEHDFGENISFKNAFSLWQKKRAEEIIFKSERMGNSNKNKTVELYFETEEINNFWEKLKESSINIIHGLKEEPWGQRTLRFFDPDHFIVEVAEPLDHVVIRMAKAGASEAEISHKTQLSPQKVRDLLKEAN